MTTWIAEALGVIGPSASPIAVAKSVWAQHEQEIRASGDLLYTWQLDLQTATEAMISEGTLALADGEWSLTDTSPPPPARRRTWDDDERSEEHTSELQSLMRISYAFFCL